MTPPLSFSPLTTSTLELLHPEIVKLLRPPSREERLPVENNFDYDCESEEGLEGSKGPSKSTPSRSSSKKSRAAEVHNLSEKDEWLLRGNMGKTSTRKDGGMEAYIMHEDQVPAPYFPLLNGSVRLDVQAQHPNGLYFPTMNGHVTPEEETQVSYAPPPPNRREAQLLPFKLQQENLKLTMLPSSDLRIERLVTLRSNCKDSAVMIEDIPADTFGCSFVLKLPSRQVYFWCSEKSMLLGTELLAKVTTHNEATLSFHLGS